MISRLRPLGIAISFEERTYRLGEPIDLTIKLTPRRDCEVREGRIDLMVEGRWASTVTYEKPTYVKVPRGMGSRMGGPSMGLEQVGTETKEMVKNRKETSAHGSAVFLENSMLKSGRPYQYSVRLEIRLQPPAYPTDAKIKWWLQTEIDVADARDTKRRNKVSIAV